MLFSQEVLEAARRLRQQGLPWSPGPGHFVLDEEGVIEQPSPFQDRVYFILDIKHFLRRTGSIDGLQRAMTWLPLWHDARDLLRSRGISEGAVAEALRHDNAIESRSELLTLYRLLEKDLQKERD